MLTGSVTTSSGGRSSRVASPHMIEGGKAGLATATIRHVRPPLRRCTRKPRPHRKMRILRTQALRDDYRRPLGCTQGTTPSRAGLWAPHPIGVGQRGGWRPHQASHSYQRR